MPKSTTVKIKGKIFDKEWMAEYVKTRMVSQVAAELGLTYASVNEAANRYKWQVVRVAKRQCNVVQENRQLCWKCARATNGNLCPWVKNFIPVPGWEAEPTTIYTTSHQGDAIDSYRITKCPLYTNKL